VLGRNRDAFARYLLRDLEGFLGSAVLSVSVGAVANADEDGNEDGRSEGGNEKDVIHTCFSWSAHKGARGHSGADLACLRTVAAVFDGSALD
jgi:hypothetical protein